jgi:hypothetical protein
MFYTFIIKKIKLNSTELPAINLYHLKVYQYSNYIKYNLFIYQNLTH